MARSFSGGLAAKLVGAALAACLALGLAGPLASCASTAPSPIAREWFDLGNAWLEKGDWKRAGQAFSRALALDPNYAGASYNLTRAFIESGDYDRALQALDTLEKRDPGNVKILALRAYSLYKKGDAKAALDVYRKLLKLDEFSADAVYNAALLELASGNADAAIADLQRLTSAKPDDGQAFLLLGRSIDRRAADAAKKPAGPSEKASGEASSKSASGEGTIAAAGAGTAPAKGAAASETGAAAEAPAPGSAGGETRTASPSAVLTDDEAAALAAYETAKTLGKTDADALERMAQLYEKERLFTEAMDSLDEALKADPKRASAAFSLARLRLVVADDSEKGLEALKTALDAGFSDKDAAAALLAEPDLPDRQKVYDLLKSKDLAE